MELQEIKEFLRVDFDEDDKLIATLKLTAEAYIKNSGSKISNYDNALYKLAILLLIGHWFENREVIGTDEKLAYSLQCLLLQLQYCYEDVK